MYCFPDIDKMPDLPAIPIQDYLRLAEEFRAAILDPANQVIRYSSSGHPSFSAYINSKSNEMVTWGVLAVGEWLSGRDAAWIGITYNDFFHPGFGLFLNSPDASSVEFWYLFYIHMLAGAVMATLYPLEEAACKRMASSADALLKLAKRVNYNFNHQGYHFDKETVFTNRDIYRQPDSIAGFAYNMLFASLRLGKRGLLEESAQALERYQEFAANPWYEIPNGSAGLMAAAWLTAHDRELNVKKMAGWVFDHHLGPMQLGKWGKEEVDGLMMGWRGDSRQSAMDSAYSMETLMPLQFLLPSVRYCPQLANAVAKYARCALSNFALFYANGLEPLFETKPGLTPSIPYEKLVKKLEDHSPAACGDFAGHRSIYGAGYLLWAEALARPTNNKDILALDLSLTDWLASEKYPVFMLRNHLDTEMTVSFSPAVVWRKIRPALYKGNWLCCDLWDVWNSRPMGIAEGPVTVTIGASSVLVIALLPGGTKPHASGMMLAADGAELFRILS